MINYQERSHSEADTENSRVTTGKRPVRGAAWLATYLVQAVVLIVLGMLVLSLVLTFSEKGILGNNFYTILEVVTVDERGPSFAGLDWQTFSAVSMQSSNPDLWSSRVMFIVATALDFVTYFAIAGFVFVLAHRFRNSRPFTQQVRVGLMVIAGGLTITATIAPWLRIVADQIFVNVLELATSGDSITAGADASNCTVCEWVNYPYFSFEYDFNWLLIALAVVLIFVGLSYQQAERLQRDTEGLV